MRVSQDREVPRVFVHECDRQPETTTTSCEIGDLANLRWIDAEPGMVTNLTRLLLFSPPLETIVSPFHPSGGRMPVLSAEILGRYLI